MRQPPRLIGRRIMRRVERRVHQNMIGGVGSKAGISELRDRRRDIKTNHAHALGERIARGVFARQCGEVWIEFHQRDGKPFDAESQRQSGRADAGAELDRMLARPRRCCRRKQRGVMAKAVAAKRLPQREFATKKRVFAGRVRCGGHQRLSGRSSWPKPASSSKRRAMWSSSSPTKMRRGKMPIEPSSTLIF